ncbi:MAG TPA: undecaprenyl diphosphate synthase family protein [Vicinamibacterales bacterium]|nr:undecaprenyl diphosphate synthase family protein [Vicinamibacterales bacterium]
MAIHTQLGRIPRHIGFIPDGNRRWAVARGLQKRAGYAAGIEPGLRLIDMCRELGVEEVSAYGFTKENVRRPSDQVACFREACAEFALAALDAGVALLAVGDTRSELFPDALRPFSQTRSPGDIRFNLLVNYGWEWDLAQACAAPRGPGRGRPAFLNVLGSRGVSRVDLVVRWGGRRRLSGFLPIQCAYADFCTIDTLWPDMRLEEAREALAWYCGQDVTMGG